MRYAKPYIWNAFFLSKKKFLGISSFVLMLFVLFLFFPSFSNAGYWSSSGITLNSACNEYGYVMCAEKDISNTTYRASEGLIPYWNASGAEKTNFFCAVFETVENQPEIKFLNGSEYGFTDLMSLKESSYLASESMDAKTYSTDLSVPAVHFDENCNADELFTKRLANGGLDLSKYEENGVVYDVLSDPGNIDFFDIIALEGLGTYVYGTIVNKNSGEAITGANITLYFENSAGSFKPYLSILSDDDGYYTTLWYNRTIETYFDNYSNINKIPLTSYILTAKHPFYEDYVLNFALDVTTPKQFTIEMVPYGVCQSDCTFEGSSLCREECDGINGCEFPTFAWDSEYSIKSHLNLQKSGQDISFVYDGTVLEYQDRVYEVSACEGTPYELDVSESSSVDNDPVCPSGKDAWVTERFVEYNGKLVKSIVLQCR